MPENIRIKTDAVIFGGGVSGLWTLNILKHAGYNVFLLESQSLGFDQTITCQGILHGGVKYSLAGKLTKSAINIKDMPGIWKEHLQGRSHPDLSNVNIRSEYCYLWGQTMWLVGSLFGLSVRPRKVPPAQKPPVLAAYKGVLYKLGEQIISPASLLKELTANLQNSLLHVSMNHLQCRRDNGGNITEIHVMTPEKDHSLTLLPDTVILTAGAGNGPLRRQLGFPEEKMQRRPLHMVVVKGASLPFFNGHYIENALPGVTVTSSRTSDGEMVWLLGGRLAEKSISWDSVKLVKATRQSLIKIFPSFEFNNLQWATFRVDRAEADTCHCRKPDDVYVEKEGNVITAWPTKLVLAPRLADRILGKIGNPSAGPLRDETIFENWPKPKVSPEPWENVEWISAH